MTIEEVWNKIKKHEGETFSTKTGIQFSYFKKMKEYILLVMKKQGILRRKI